jgi:hypothetical protein
MEKGFATPWHNPSESISPVLRKGVANPFSISKTAMDTDELALPPNPELLNRQPKWFKPVLGMCIGASALFAIALLLFAPPMIIPTHRHADMTEAISNARQISLALLEFEMDNGSYPSAATIPLVVKKHPAHGHMLAGTSSNTFFRQLFVEELTYSEQMFHARVFGINKPDSIITPGKALEKGECAFSYISGLSSKDDPLTPIVLTPLIPGTTKFDPKPFDGKAIILHIDNSVRSYDIAKDGHIYDAKGINLLSPKHPIWKGKAPDIRYPEL